ncbi:MAG: hypothetical protein AAF636_11485 [Pseudomonadota bacterium]
MLDITVDPIAATPVGFTQIVLGIPQYQWQANVLFDLEKLGQVAVKCPNEGGKTSHIVVGAVLWHMMCFPGSVTVVTSASFRQLKHQLMPGLQRQQYKPCFKDWEFVTDTIKAPNGSSLVAFSAVDPGKFEGFHNLPETKVGEDEDGNEIMERPPLMIIVDEAKSVTAAIFTAIDRCRPDRLLLLSSPGANVGEFYNAFGKNKAHYKTHSAGLKDCPHLDPEKIQRIIDKYGETHPFVLSSVYGQFATDPDSGVVIDSAALELCIAEPPQWQPGVRHAFCDFAAGGDENVLALREGNRVTLEDCWHETNTMAAVARFIQNFVRLGLQPDEISGDNSGLGKPIIDRMHELGWPIRRITNNSKAKNPAAYKDLISELWGEGAKQVADKSLILPDNDELTSQMTTRLWEDRTSDGAMKVQSKKKMKLDGLPSPDRAEAVLGSLLPPSAARVNLMENSKSLQPVTEWHQRKVEEEIMCGFDAGL